MDNQEEGTIEGAAYRQLKIMERLYPLEQTDVDPFESRLFYEACQIYRWAKAADMVDGFEAPAVYFLVIQKLGRMFVARSRETADTDDQ